MVNGASASEPMGIQLETKLYLQSGNQTKQFNIPELNGGFNIFNGKVK